MTDQTPTPQTKKDPYTGDPVAKLTICPKKLRRYLNRDLLYLPITVEVEDAGIPAQVDGEEQQELVKRPVTTVAVICKHCNGDPSLQKKEFKPEPNLEEPAA